MTDQDRCPNCGKYLEKDPDGFYGRLHPDRETSLIVPFCDEQCCNDWEDKCTEYGPGVNDPQIPGRLPNGLPSDERLENDQ